MEYEKFKEQFVEDLKERLQVGGGEYLVEPHEFQIFSALKMVCL